MVRYSIGPRAELRPLEENDADAVFALTDQSRASLRRWLPWVDATTSVDDSRQFIRAAVQHRASGDAFQFGIWNHGRLAGVIGLSIDGATGSAELGYWLGDSFRGQGLMTRACRTLVAYAVGALALQRVVIRAATDNWASRAVAERLGFHLERIEPSTYLLHDQRVELAIYAMRAAEWLAAPASTPPE